MSQLLRIAFALAALAALTLAAPDAHAAPVPAEAGKAVTLPYPANAPVVVQLNGHGSARDRLGAMLKAAVPDDAAKIDKMIDDGLTQLLTGRRLSAVPKDGRVFLVVHDIAALFDNTLALSVLVPVTSYKDFRDTFLTEDEWKTFTAGKNGVDELKINLLGEELALFAVDLKEYVALSPDKATAETYAKRYTKATTAAMAPELARSFTAADLSVYVNLEVINERHGDQIRAFKGFIDFAFMQAPMGQFPGMNKKQIEAAKIMLHGAFRAVEDARGAVLAVEFRPEGLNVRAQAQFAEDTASVQLLKPESPTPAKGVEKLPAGLGNYSAWVIGRKFQDALRGLNPEFAPADDDEKGNAALEKRQKELLDAGQLSEIAGASTPGVSLAVRSFKEPGKAVAALVGCYEVMTPGGRIMTAILKEAPKVTKGAKKHRGFTFTEIRLAFDFEATVQDLPEGVKESTLAQLKRMLAEKATVWVGTDGKSVVQAGAKDWDAAAGALDQYLDAKKTVGDTAGYKLTRKNLPPEVNYLMLMETGETMTTIIESLRAVAGAVPDFPKIGKIETPKGDSTYIGVAVTLKGDTASFNLFVPGPAIAAGRDLLNQMMRKLD